MGKKIMEATLESLQLREGTVEKGSITKLVR